MDFEDNIESVKYIINNCFTFTCKNDNILDILDEIKYVIKIN